MNFVERLNFAFKREQERRAAAGLPRLTKTNIWKAAKATSGAASHWFNGSNGMDLDTCYKAATVLNVNPFWLFDESKKIDEPGFNPASLELLRGHVYDHDHDYDPENEAVISNSSTPPRPVRAWTNEDELEAGDVLVPTLELRLSAGPGEVCWQIDRKGRGRVFQSDYLDRLGVKQECAATMTVSGTSMEPRLWDGDSVLVDYYRQTVLDGNVYALVWQDEYYIKRLFKEPGGSIRMVSDNPDKSRHPDRLITTEHMEELQIIGRVVGIVGGRL